MSYTNEPAKSLKYSLQNSNKFYVSISQLFFFLIETPWYIFNQSYFQYVEIQHTHYDAQKYCEEQNGGLASISSEEEQTFLYKTFILPSFTGQYCTIIP